MQAQAEARAEEAIRDSLSDIATMFNVSLSTIARLKGEAPAEV